MKRNQNAMEVIQRKTLMYKTGVEYGDFCINHAKGCAHGCKYCYQLLGAKRYGQVKSYEQWCEPKLVSNAVELVNKEIPKLKNKIESVHLSFTTDPFMVGYPEVGQMTLKLLEELNAKDIPCTVLTKGILPKELEGPSFLEENYYGITIVSLEERFRKEWEPGAAPLKERIKALRYLHDKGCRTWVSIEPYPTPNIIEQDLLGLLDAVSFSDKIIFGRWNYCRDISAYSGHKQFYNEQASVFAAYCERRKIKYHIKEGTITAK